MAWTNAPSVKAGLAQATKRWPKRSKVSDGTVGDAAHAAGKSDHNPDAKGIVHAFDLTHDPKNGVDCEVLSALLVARKDSRVKYIIWNKRIIESSDWKWKEYKGKNPHTKHMHVSIHSTKKAEDDVSDWWEPPSEVVPIVDYIVGEMNRNANGVDAKTILDYNSYTATRCIEDYGKLPIWRQLADLGVGRLECVGKEVTYRAAALMQWALLVRQDGPWDHKPHIRKTFVFGKAREQTWHRHKGFRYFYDIWSNLHYGYVGAACGFSESVLLDGAGLEQIGSDGLRWLQGKGSGPKASSGVDGLRKYDDPSDREAISIGIRLYRSPSGAVTREQVLREVELSSKLTRELIP